MNDDLEIPGEYWDSDLLYLEEIQLKREERHNEVTGTIESKLSPPNTKARANLSRGQVLKSEHSQGSKKSDC